MRVACIGNMNHMLFTVARYLREAGYSADLFLLNNESDVFDPETDSYSQEYVTYTHRLNWGNAKTFMSVSAQEIRDEFAHYDAIIASHTAPAFLHKAAVPIDLFIPHGSDIYGLPAWGQEFWHQLELWRIFFSPKTPAMQERQADCLLSRAQRRAILSTKKIMINQTNRSFEQVLSQGVSTTQRIREPCPFVFTTQYDPDLIQRHYSSSEAYRHFASIRQKYDFMIFHHARHVWKYSPDVWSEKGNDVLIRGFARFARESPSRNACLVVFEYGPEVAESKALIQKLGIEDAVVWMPMMDRKEIMIGLSLADMGAGEFANSWFSYGVAQEVLAMGKPLIHYRDDPLYSHMYPELYPMLSARTPRQVANALGKVYEKPDHYRKMGLQGRQWYQTYMVERPLRLIKEAIQA